MCESHALSEAAVEKSSSFILLGDLSYLLTVFSAVSVSLFFFSLACILRQARITPHTRLFSKGIDECTLYSPGTELALYLI